MASTTSISQGSFLVLPKNFDLPKLRKSRKRKLKDTGEENWEKTFNKVWEIIEKEIKDVNEHIFKNVLKNLIEHIKTLHNETKIEDGVLPCEILLTGSNLPDHSFLRSALTDSLKEITSHISVLESRSCGNIKNAITNFVKQIIPVYSKDVSDLDDENCDDKDDEEKMEEEVENKANSKIKLQASQYNLSTLCAWHASQAKKKKKRSPIVIFLPDFESISPKVLSELILLLSSYSSQAPFILIFGVATTPAVVYQSLPRRVLSQVVIQLFKSEQSMSVLNQIIEKIFFSEKCPFRLGTKCMTFLIDIFLFHSFSVQGFIQGFKFCMMEHFYKKNHFSLCCLLEDIQDQVKVLEFSDLESLRRMPSFQKHVENSSKDDRKLLLLDTDHTKKTVEKMIRNVREKLSNFHVALKCLHILTNDLPQYPLGRHLREYYCKAISTSITTCSEYKESMKMLQYQSCDELVSKVSLIVDLLKLNSIADILSSDSNSKFDEIINELEKFKQKFNEIAKQDSSSDSANSKNPSEFEDIRKSFLDYVEKEIIVALIQPITDATFHEVILFDDLPAVRRKISGSPRGAIHSALNNPQYYLECECCVLPHPEAVLPTLPDLSIAYKLHLEFSKVINLYDWLQAFAACVAPELTENEINEEMQARFTRAVSELQFLGFIKPSRSKSDYVNRLTWSSS